MPILYPILYQGSGKSYLSHLDPTYHHRDYTNGEFQLESRKKITYKYLDILFFSVSNHPNMKEVVVGEVERLLYRPNISAKAQ